MNLLADVLDVFNKTSCFTNLRLYMSEFCLCSRMRHVNINQTQWLKSHAHLKGDVASQAMDIYVIDVIHIGKTLIRCLWMLGVLHAQYVYYHPIDNFCLTISLRMECSGIDLLSVQQ